MTIAEDSPNVSEIELPISRCTVVITERGARQTLELLGPDGELIGVVSDSTLDPSVIRSAYRGGTASAPWALAAGRSVKSPVKATFAASRSRRDLRRIEVTASECGGFWVAEAAITAHWVSVTVDGEENGSSSLQPIS